MPGSGTLLADVALPAVTLLVVGLITWLPSPKWCLIIMILRDWPCRTEQPGESWRIAYLRSGKLSRTAQFIALNRALGTLSPQVPGFSDPLAVHFLPEKIRQRVQAARVSLERNPGKSPYPFWFRGMGVFNQFRTVIFDRAITSAFPLPQLVILGAGLDTRAWRLDGLEDTVVFEVDHPSTQAWKRERAAALHHKAKDVHFVATDFRQNTLAPLLRNAGFDASKSTFWLWEGVTMYLTEAAVKSNLATFAALSAPGSHLALTYLRKVDGRVPRSLVLSLMGEPVRSAYAPDELTGLAKTHGWGCTSDSNIEDWIPAMAPRLNLTKFRVGFQWLESIWIGVYGMS
jgi:methyltransferase (TIGR00027 family)